MPTVPGMPCALSRRNPFEYASRGRGLDAWQRIVSRAYPSIREADGPTVKVGPDLFTPRDCGKPMKTVSTSGGLRRGGRAVEGTGLENRRPARVREFESRPL